MSSSQTYERTLEKLAMDDERIVVVTAENRAAIRGLPEKLGPRFVDVGIAEQTMIGAAAGLALRGRIPICHALATFLVMRAFEFIRTDVGIARLPVKLVGGVPGFLSDGNGPTHQAIEDVALMRSVPNMQIVCPSDRAELVAALPEILASSEPTYVRYCASEPAVEHVSAFELGRAEALSEGSDVAILTYGFLLREAVKARALLEAQDRTVRLVDMRSLAPIDEAAILAAARECSIVVTFEDHLLAGGLYAIVCELLVRRGVKARVVPVALGTWFKPGRLDDVLAYEGFTGSALAERIVSLLGRRPGPLGGRDLPSIVASERLLARAMGLVPAATQTLAKGPGQFVRGVAPVYAKRGKAGHVWDVDGNEYVDLQMAVGPLSLGYGYPAVDDAIRAQLDDGITFSLMHPLEVEVAELVRRVVPGTEMVRFSKTGCDVTSAAVRLARAFTGRSKVLSCGYHGWHDWHVAVTDRHRGVPGAVQDLSWTFPYNDIDALRASLDNDVACVILEPTVVEAPAPGYLQALRDACRENGALLVFDEMWTGFRLALGGAQERFGVTADLACFSKAVANGMPLSILSGRGDVMRLLDEDVFFFTTFGGEALSLAAAKATIHEIEKHDVPAYLARQGRRIKEGYNAIARDLGLTYTSAVGHDCRSLVTFSPDAGDPLAMKSLVQQELIRRGVLWSGFHTMTFGHTDADVDHVLASYREVLPILARAVEGGVVRETLRGEPVRPVFRRTTKFDTKPRRT